MAVSGQQLAQIGAKAPCSKDCSVFLVLLTHPWEGAWWAAAKSNPRAPDAVGHLDMQTARKSDEWSPAAQTHPIFGALKVPPQQRGQFIPHRPFAAEENQHFADE